MKTGTFEFIRRLHCPHCEYSKDADEIGQYQDFEFIAVDDPGTFQIWKCLKCNKKFRIDLG